MPDLNDVNRRVLKVDLTSGEVNTFEIDPEVYRRFLGGRGLNQYRLYQLLEPNTSPLGPENLLLFGAGLLSGTSVPGASRLSVDSKNIFSCGVGSANVGGGLSSALKRAGYGTVMVSGKEPSVPLDRGRCLPRSYKLKKLGLVPLIKEHQVPTTEGW